MLYRCVAALGLMLLLSGCGYTYRGTVIEPPNEAFNFTLTDQNGQPFTLAEQQGQVVLLFFGFTSCPDICPLELTNLTSVKRKLGDGGADLRVAFISLDPERDTTERLKQYVSSFDPSFIGLRGSPEELKPITEAYGVFYERRDLPDSALVYTIDHSGFVYAIDRAGKWRLLFAHGTSPDDIAADVQALLRER